MKNWNINVTWSWENETRQYGDGKKWNKEENFEYKFDRTFEIIMHAHVNVFLPLLIITSMGTTGIPTMGLNILFIQTLMLDFMPYVVSFKWIFVSYKFKSHKSSNGKIWIHY